MAQRLMETHSPGLCVKSSKRHVRICGHLPGTEFLVDPIKPVIKDLEAKIELKKAATEEKDVTFDSIGYYDTLQDTAIRSVALRAQEYDQNNPGSQTYKIIFPENTSDLIRMNPADEAVEIEKVVTRITSLGETHPLFPFAATLKEKAANVTKAVKAHLDSITAVGAAEAQLQIAKSALIKQYLSNMFDAEKKFGRKVASSLFPRITKGDSGPEEEQNN